MEVLCGFWKDQQDAITYQELRQAVLDGTISQGTVDLWMQDYSVLVADKLRNMWMDAIAAGPSGQPILDSLVFEFNTQSPGILNWLSGRGADFVTACTQEQKDAIAALLTKKIKDGHTVDELARMIRPCIGLTEGQAKANARYYDNIVATLKKEHPCMKEESIRKKAMDAATKYAERQHRERALTIAQTESAFAYHRGADEGIRQAQAEGYLGTMVKRWSTSGDDAVCDLCASLEGVEVSMNADFNIGGKVLFRGQHMLPPAHPRCACAIEYIEESPAKTYRSLAEVENQMTQIDDVQRAQEEYDSHFEGQTLDKETYQKAAIDMAQLGYDVEADRVVQMVDSVYNYTKADYTDILAAQSNFSGRFSDYSSIMTDADKQKALQDVKNIHEFIENSPAYEGKVFRGLGFDVGGPLDKGDYESFRNLYKKGATIQTDTFTSWTSDEDVLRQIHSARTFIDEECEYSVEVTIQMKNCETGVDISSYAELKGQKEVLFDKTALKVLDIKENWKDDEVLQVLVEVEEM